MTDKKSFGSFIRAKRLEKNYSQQELAALLFVTEGAVSKWERGATYPDITLIADICRVLDISEHEFITASIDTDTRRMKREARQFRIIRSTWFWVPTIAYGIALIPCFICNLAIDHTLSWFFIVLAALLCAYTFVPSFTLFFQSRKLLVFTITSFASICVLLFTCGIYTGGLSWVPVACIGTLMGYVAFFLPVLLANTKARRFRFLITFSLVFVLTLLLLLVIRLQTPFPLLSAWLITAYAFAPVLFCTVVSLLRGDGFIKAAVCIYSCSIAYYLTGHLTNLLFGLNENHYEVDFTDWTRCITGNVHSIVLLSCLFIATVFLAIGVGRSLAKKKG